jgi:tRNA nucleotidyltransferase (CCA-adding enzyme)
MYRSDYGDSVTYLNIIADDDSCCTFKVAVPVDKASGSYFDVVALEPRATPNASIFADVHPKEISQYGWSQVGTRNEIIRQERDDSVDDMYPEFNQKKPKRPLVIQLVFRVQL